MSNPPKNLGSGQTPPPPSWQCQDFEGFLNVPPSPRRGCLCFVHFEREKCVDAVLAAQKLRLDALYLVQTSLDCLFNICAFYRRIWICTSFSICSLPSSHLFGVETAPSIFVPALYLYFYLCFYLLTTRYRYLWSADCPALYIPAIHLYLYLYLYLLTTRCRSLRTADCR